MSTQKAPSRTLSNVSRNTYLVLLCSAHAYKTWKVQNPHLDAARHFPGFDPSVIRMATGAYKVSRPLSTDEVLQHLELLMQFRLISRRPSSELRDNKPFHHTLTEKGEKVYDRLATIKVQGHPMLHFMLDKRNRKLWNALVVMSFLARPKTDAVTDDQLAQMTGLSTSAVRAGRKMASEGMTLVNGTGGGIVFKPAEILTSLSGGFTSRCLDPEQWVDDDKIDDLDALLDGTPGQPAKPKPNLKVVTDPDKMHGAADGFGGSDQDATGAVSAKTIKDELKKLGIATGGKSSPTPTKPAPASTGQEIKLPISNEHYALAADFLAAKGTTIEKMMEQHLDHIVAEAMRFGRKAKERRLAEIKAEKKRKADELAKMQAELDALEAELKDSI